MKALTIRQPWAGLIAAGVKTIETRSWSTKHRGTIAIHAGAKSASRLADDPAGMLGDWWVVIDGGEPALLDHRRGRGTDADVYAMPLGAIVATATLIDCLPINPQVGHEHEEYDPPDDHIYTTVDGQALYRQQVIGDPSNPRNVISTDLTDQLPLGDYTPGRWAWLLGDVTPIEPVPTRGKQGLWSWDQS